MHRTLRRKSLHILALSTAGLLALASAHAFEAQQEATLVSGNTWGDNYGVFAAAVDGNTVVVGAEKDNRLGKVYVYTDDGSGWSLEQTILPPDPLDAASFGKTVEVRGDSMFVARHGDVYVFERTAGSWNHVQTLSPSDGGFAAQNIPQFGGSLDVSGDVLVVGGKNGGACGGAPCYMDKVYVFEKQGGLWVETAILRASDDPGNNLNRFGWDVSTDGVGIAVGAIIGNKGVYVFERDGAGGWVETAKLSPSVREPGSSLELSGDSLVIGDRSWSGSGRVTVHERVGGVWTQVQELTDVAAGQYAQYGDDIEVDGSLMAVGAPGPGIVFIYEHDGSSWVKTDSLGCGDSLDYLYGKNVGLSGTTVVAGGCYTPNPNTFEVQVYSAGAPDTDGDGVTDDVDNCVNIPNADQSDVDSDGFGDVCDLCSGDDVAGDSDADLVCDDIDNCPTDVNTDQADDDGDGLGNACELDSDGDGKIDDIDNCPADSNPDQADSDADGQGDVCDPDDDGDGVDDVEDNCPILPNPGQVDSDGDGQGDVCDGDDDGDGVSDEYDLCPGTPIDVLWDEDGCSGVQLIDATCGEPSGHPNHGQYVRCVSHAGNDAVAAGLITSQERAAIVRAAAKNK